MSLSRQKLSNGKLSKNYSYDFRYLGERYRGTTGASTKREAEKFVENLKLTLKGSINESMQHKSLIHFREKVTESIKGKSITLDKVWAQFRKEAPAMLKRDPSPKQWKSKEGYWNDFKAFLETQEDVSTLRDITEEHARAYVTHLKTSGKYQKTIQYGKSSYSSKISSLAPSTINEYITQLKQILNVLTRSAGLLENPFDNIPKLENKKKTRDVFEVQELELISQFIENKDTLPNSSNHELDHIIIKSLFLIGLTTGLRRGDIALLRWEDINFHKKAINKTLNKTGEQVFIPLQQNVFSFIQEQKQSKENDYVIPELAEMYQTNDDGISYRFKKLLTHLGIKSQKAHDGRSRQSSTKDIHSLRHTFCYLHGMQGTPLMTVQSMTGHMTAKMTEAYTMHQTEELKRQAIEQLETINLLPTTGLEETQKLDNKSELLNSLAGSVSEENLAQIEAILNKK